MNVIPNMPLQRGVHGWKSFEPSEPSLPFGILTAENRKEVVEREKSAPGTGPMMNRATLSGIAKVREEDFLRGARQAFRYLVDMYNGASWAQPPANAKGKAEGEEGAVESGPVEPGLAELFRRQRKQHEQQGRVNKILLDESSVQATILSVDLIFSGMFGKGPVTWPFLRSLRFFRLYLMVVTRANPMLFWAGSYNCGIEAKLVVSARMRSEWQQLETQAQTQGQQEAPPVPASDTEYSRQEHLLTLYLPLGPKISHEKLMEMAHLKWLQDETEYKRIKKICDEAVGQATWTARNINQTLPLPHPFNAARIALQQAAVSAMVRKAQEDRRKDTGDE